MFQQPITNSVLTNEKIENLSKEPKVIKEPNGNIKLKNTITNPPPPTDTHKATPKATHQPHEKSSGVGLNSRI